MTWLVAIVAVFAVAVLAVTVATVAVRCGAFDDEFAVVFEAFTVESVDCVFGVY